MKFLANRKFCITIAIILFLSNLLINQNVSASTGTMIRGDEDQRILIEWLQSIRQNLKDQNLLNEKLENSLLQIENALLNSELSEEEWLKIQTKLSSYFMNSESIAKIYDDIESCINYISKDQLQNRTRVLNLYDPLLHSQKPKANMTEKMAMVLTELKKTNSLTKSVDYVGFLTLQEICEAYPLSKSNIEVNLNSEIKNILIRFEALLEQLVSIKDYEDYESYILQTFESTHTYFEETKNKIQNHFFKERTKNMRYLLVALEYHSRTNTQLIKFTPEALNEAREINEIALKLVNNGQYDEARQLAEAAIRSSMPIEVSHNKTTDELYILIQSYLSFLGSTSALVEHTPQEYKHLESLLLKALDSNTLYFLKQYSDLLKHTINNNQSLDLDLQRNLSMAAPAIATEHSIDFFDAVIRSFTDLRREFEQNQTFMQGFQSSYNESVLNEILKLDHQISKLRRMIMETPDQELLNRVVGGRERLRSVLTSFFEAVNYRYSTVKDYSQVIQNYLADLESNSYDSKRSSQHFDSLRKLINQDTSDHKMWHVYLTRQNMMTGALSALLIAEVLTLQLQTVPATLTAISVGSRAVMVMGASLNIADRVKFNGLSGLVNFETGLDILTLLSFMPHAAPRAVTASGFWGKSGQQMRNAWGMLVRDSMRMAIYINAGMSSYQIAFAESIAERMKANGINMTAADVRAQGFKQLIMTTTFFVLNRRLHQHSVRKYGDDYLKEINYLKFKNTTAAQALTTFDIRFRNWIPNGLRNYGNAIKSAWQMGGIGGFLGASWKALAIPAYNYILANEIVFFSYSTPDVVFENHVKNQSPLPDLKDNESAVLMVGLESADILYAGAHSKDYQRDLILKYGSKFKVYNFESPRDFFHILAEHAEKHGKIKYLKIITHGLPGMMATSAAFESPSNNIDGFNHLNSEGYINVGFLQKNKSKLNKITQSAMGSDAHVVLISCLVGSNYDDFEKTFANDTGHSKIGDQFLDEFADVMLPKNGRVDASTRVLVGLDMIYSSLFLHDSLARQYANESKSFNTIPLKRYAFDQTSNSYDSIAITDQNHEIAEPKFDIKKAILPSQTSLDEENHLMFLAHRFTSIVINFPTLVNRYGIALEGPFWHDRYKFRIITGR